MKAVYHTIKFLLNIRMYSDTKPFPTYYNTLERNSAPKTVMSTI